MGQVIGQILMWGSGIVMLGFEVLWFYRWWDMAGVLASVFIPPLVAFFPFIYLVLEGFSPLYFGVWVLGLLGLMIASSGDELAY